MVLLSVRSPPLSIAELGGGNCTNPLFFYAEADGGDSHTFIPL